MPDLQRYPYKLCLIKCKSDVHVFFSINHFFHLRAGFSSKVNCAFPAFKKHWGNDYFYNHENENIFDIFDQIEVTRHNCKPGIAIFSLRVI